MEFVTANAPLENNGLKYLPGQPVPASLFSAESLQAHIQAGIVGPVWFGDSDAVSPMSEIESATEEVK